MKFTLVCLATVLVGLSGPVAAQMSHGGAQGHMHGAYGEGHDMSRMPGLQGRNATSEESMELAVMFRGFQTMSREVERLPNGIRTVTTSNDPMVMDALVSHTVGMIDRVGQKNDPQIMIQSPTLDIFFARGDGILSEVEVTEEGIVVVQTSEDPTLVEALYEHADEVTAMVDRGMHAVHEMMMKRAGN